MGSPEVKPATAPEVVGATPISDDKHDIAQIERTLSTNSITKEHANFDRVDPEVAKYAENNGVIVSEADNKRLKKLIDRRVLSVMIVTYFLQALDKGTLSFASIMGIRKDLDLDHSQRYPWLTTCIYIGVLAVEYPTNWIIQRVPIAKYLALNICLWGAVLALQASATNFPGILALRTLLGVFEAVCQPAFLILSSMWYRRSEQAEAVTFYYMMNGGQQIVGGLLAYAFTKIGNEGPIVSWQVLFITYGVISVCWGVFVFLYMPDSPMRAKCFSEADKAMMVERVRSNQTGLQNKKFRMDQFKEAFTDPQTWCYCLIQLCTTLPTSGLGAFANIIITSFDFTILQTQLLAMVLGAVIIAILLSSTYLTKRYNQNVLIMLLYVIPSFVGTIVLLTVENKSLATKVGLLISYYIALSFWAAQTLGMSMLSRNVGGATKKSVVVTCNFVSWCVGNSIGPQVFLDWDAPRYRVAFSVHIGCYTVLVAAMAFLRWWLIKENKRKDALQEREGRDERLVHAFDDLTDRENRDFRYIY